jgi:hypothetical protein
MQNSGGESGFEALPELKNTQVADFSTSKIPRISTIAESRAQISRNFLTR